MDLTTKKVLVSFEHDAGDIYDYLILSERLNGEVAITDLNTKKTVASVKLNQSRLGAIEAIAVSPDFSRLALSTKSRGATWDLTHNIRVHYSREFTGAWFGEDGSVYADFPKLDKQERSIARLDTFGNTRLTYTLAKQQAHQSGPYLVIEEPEHEDSLQRKDWTVTIRDFRTQDDVWKRQFPREVPDVALQSEKTLLLGWPMSAASTKEELQQFPDLKDRAEREDYLFEVLDFPKGLLRGKVLIKTNKNSFHVLSAVTDGDWLAVRASSDRIFVYSLSTGEEKAHVFGDYPAVSQAAAAFSVGTVNGELNLYDLPNGQLRRQYKFHVPVAYQKFSSDGKKLFVLTRDQTAYVLDLTSSN